MGLIDLQTDLKSLKFGKDRPGGGSSGQPYIKSNIPDKDQPSFLDTDFVWRGGLKAPIRAAEDVARLSKYIFDPKSPRGALFVAKQNLLSRTAVSTEASTGPAYANGGLNGGVYTPLSTLAQAGIGWTGTHLNKQGIDPTGLIPGLSINKYEKIVWEKNKDIKNTLIDSTAQQGFIETRNLNRLVRYYNQFKNIPSERSGGFISSPTLDDYNGGPSSVLGIGKTRIKFATDGGGNPLKSPSYSQKNYDLSSYIYNNDQQDQNRFIFNKTSYNIDRDEQTKTHENSIKGEFTRLYSSNPLERYTIFGLDKELKFNLTNPLIDSSIIPIPYKNYQAKGKSQDKITKEEDSTYESPISFKLEENDRELYTPPIFDKVTGQWKTYSTLTGINKYLGEYSSAQTLKNDKLGNWKEYAGGTEPKPHQDGYLANLDKNAGSYITNNQKFIFTNNNYQGGIAPDFRLTDRETRGFSDSITIVDDLNNQAKKWIVDGKLSKKTSQKENIYKAIDTIYYSSSPSSFKSSQKLNQEDGLIPFNIEIIPSSTYNTTGSNNQNNKLRFRAYIDSISDSYSSGWNSQKYMGRAESFYKYESFDRDISFSFTVVADSKDNLDIMYQMLNRLASSLTPEYSFQGYMTGNLHKITIGNYINGQYGIVKGFTYEITENTPWDINPGVKKPLYIKVSGFKFTPIHNFRPEFNTTNPKKYINQA
jgi:hypothetical protein